MITSINDRELLRRICPGYLAGVLEDDLGDVLDAWLADDLASDDHRHVYGWTDEREELL